MEPPPPLGCCRHTPGQRDAGRLLPCALPRESVSGNFSRRHVLGAFTTTTTTTTTHPLPTPPLLAPPPPPPKGASGRQLVGGVVGVQNRGVAPPGVATDPTPPESPIPTTGFAPPPPSPSQPGQPFVPDLDVPAYSSDYARLRDRYEAQMQAPRAAFA